MTTTLSVLVPTRDRPGFVARALQALRSQTHPVDEIVVVDQSRGDATADLCAALPGVRHVRDPGRGLSHARNVGLREVTGDVVAAVDDDCYAAPDWAANLLAAFADPAVSAVFGEMLPGPRTGDGDDITISTITFDEPRRHSRPAPPETIGFGGNMALRRDAWRSLGPEPCDEGLGAGTRNPGGEDMDVIHRLLRAGLTVASVPGVAVVHDQWRPAGDLGRHMYGYGRGYGAFAAKHLCRGDPYGARLLGRQLYADARFLASGVRRRSPARLRIGAARLRGTLRGVAEGPALARGARRA